MKQGDTVSISVEDAALIAQQLRSVAANRCDSHTEAAEYHFYANLLDPKPKVTDLSAVDYLAQQLYAKEFVGTTGPAREHAQFAVETIATWLRAANTNSLAAALILGENQ